MLAAALVIYYFIHAPERSDHVDHLVLAAFLLLALTGVTSAFPRQAVDAVLAALAYVALFYVARDVLHTPRATALFWALRAMCVVVTFVAASRLLPTAVEWWQLTGEAPPIGLPLVARPWGNSYDLVLLGVTLLPSLLMRPASSIRTGAGVLIGATLSVVVLMQGSRALWLAVAVATVAVAMTYAGPAVRIQSRAARRIAIGAAAVFALVIAALGGGLLDRLLTSATVGQRLAMWGAAIEAWLQRPVFGFGPGSFPWVLQSTDYFATNSIHPRHPDSAIFQLLPELGLVGIAAALLLLVGVGVPLIRHRQLSAIWPLAAFLGAGLGANPTDFSYLVVVAILWAGYALPRRAARQPRHAATWFRPANAAAFAIVAVFVTSTLVGGFAYDEAARRAASGDAAGAHDALDTAISFDPGMAVYSRQRGISSLLLGDENDAVSDLARAVGLNPNDDLSWRALAIARLRAGDTPGADDALRRALKLQRSDPANLLLLASWQRKAGDLEAFSETSAEVVLAWPSVVGAPGWRQLTGDASPDVLMNALDRWEEGIASPEPLRRQPLVLAALTGRSDLVSEATQLTGESSRLASAAAAVLQCSASSSGALSDVPPGERRTSTYWALRIQDASQHRRSDPVALRLYELISATQPSPDDWAMTMNPLHENNAQGSADAWGYDRVPIYWPQDPDGLPLPSAGASRWLLDPRAARAEAGLAGIACD